MNRMPAVIAAIATLAGVIIGGWLNHYFAVRAIGPTAQIRETTDAYVDFMNGIAVLAQKQRENDEILAQKQRENTDSSDPSLQAAMTEALTAILAAQTRILAAEARITIYGHPSVIAAMAEFRRQGSPVTADRADPFLSIVQAMRKHISNDDIGLQLKNDIRTIFFGPKRDR